MPLKEGSLTAVECKTHYIFGSYYFILFGFAPFYPKLSHIIAMRSTYNFLLSHFAFKSMSGMAGKLQTDIKLHIFILK